METNQQMNGHAAAQGAAGFNELNAAEYGGVFHNVELADQKNKRHRRSKNDTEGRNYVCPECQKSYLSIPALTNHRKSKHGYGLEGEKKGRGRPKKETISSNLIENAEEKFKLFFMCDKRKKGSVEHDESTTNNNSNNTNTNNVGDHGDVTANATNAGDMSLEVLKSIFTETFNELKNELFNDVDDVCSFPFYDFVITNYNTPSPDLGYECYDSLIRPGDPIDKKVQSCPIDGGFYKYIKYISSNTNETYFKFLLKFIIIFRECINKQRKQFVRVDHITKDKCVYTQLFNAETVPDICNDFCSDFLPMYNNFEMDFNELLEVIQHFCFFLYKEKLTQSHLVPII